MIYFYQFLLSFDFYQKEISRSFSPLKMRKCIKINHRKKREMEKYNVINNKKNYNEKNM